MRTLILSFVIFFSFAVEYNFASEVPILMWNIKGSSLLMQPVSAFEDNAKKSVSDIFERPVKDESTGLVAFIVDKLSMEDLALQPYYEDSNSTIQVLQSFLDGYPFTMYPNVRDPVKHLQKAKCGHQDLFMTPNMEGNMDKSIAAALEDNCVVIVHLPYSSSLSSKSSLFNSEIFLPKSKSLRKNIIGMFTSKMSSWESNEALNRKSRSILAMDDPDPNFVNVTGCIIMYAENITVGIGSENNETYDLAFPPTATGECANKSSLALTFGESGALKSLVLKFEFQLQPRSWIMENCTVTMTGDKIPEEEIILLEKVEAPIYFSYSCGQLVLHSDNASTPVSLTIQGFQIQPYFVEEKFSEGYNCVHWFSLPIWMGTFVVLLFITILNIGVYFLFQAKTMDRFDDPKGKTITVPQTE